MKRTDNEPKGRLLRVKEGYNPNSSSVGSIVFAFPAALLAAPAVFGAVSAVVFSRMIHRRNGAEAPESAGQTGESEP